MAIPQNGKHSKKPNINKISGSIQNKAEFSSLQIASHSDTPPADKIGFFFYSSQSIVFTLSECVIKVIKLKVSRFDCIRRMSEKS